MIRGTSLEQDSRFKDKSQKMIDESTWPEKYDKKIDLAKVDLQLLNIWIQKRINQLLGYEDDIVSGTAISLLEQYLQKQEKPNAKKIHVALSGFLANNTLIFISDLWDQLDEAQKNKYGIGKSLIEEKKKKEEEQKRKLEEIQRKKNRVKSYKFETINRFTENSQRRGQKKGRDRSVSSERSRSRKRHKKREKYRSQSRSNQRERVRYKKHRKGRNHSSSVQERRHRRKSPDDREPREEKRRRSDKDKHKSRKQRNRSSSESSHVISSSHSS